MNRLLVALIALLAVGASPAMAQLKDGRMMRIVTRNLDPDIPRGHWAAEPVVTYRVGRTHGRTEEPPDVPGRIHGLIIMNSPDAWMINRFTNIVQHVVDTGESTDIYMPHISTPGPKPYSETTKEFELGTEYDFLRGKGAIATKAQIDGVTYDKLTLEIDGLTIVLLSHEGYQRPHVLAIRQGPKMLRQVEYLAYETDLEPIDALFKPPVGARVVEAQGRIYQPPVEEDLEATRAPETPDLMTDDTEPVIKWSGS